MTKVNIKNSTVESKKLDKSDANKSFILLIVHVFYIMLIIKKHTRIIYNRHNN